MSVSKGSEVFYRSADASAAEKPVQTKPTENIHVLVITGSGISVIGGDVQLSARSDREILIVSGVTSTDLGALGVKSNGQRTTGLNTGSLTGVVNHRLVILVNVRLHNLWMIK